MSLIHDALKSMDAQPQASTPAAPARASKAVSSGGRPAWLDAVLAFAIVVAAGGLCWVIWQSQKQPKLPTLPVVAAAQPLNAVAPPPAVPEPAVVVAPQAAVVDVPAAAGAAPVDATAALAAPAVPPAAVAVAVAVPAPMPAPAPVLAAPAPVSDTSVVVVSQASMTPAPAQVAPRLSPSPHPAAPRPARGSKAVPQAAEVPPAPVVDDTPVELRFARFVAAMKNNQTTDAERELTALKARLPAGSLGLLRAQAWFDLRAGNDAAAAEQYRAILDRMPGDEEAAINLASIHSRRNKPEDARATLDAAVRLQPDSAALRAALAQFTPNARQ